MVSRNWSPLWLLRFFNLMTEQGVARCADHRAGNGPDTDPAIALGANQVDGVDRAMALVDIARISNRRVVSRPTRAMPASASEPGSGTVRAAGTTAPRAASEKSSMASPSSAPLASMSDQRIQKLERAAMSKPAMVALMAMAFAASLPFFAPGPVVFGVTKSSALKSR